MKLWVRLSLGAGRLRLMRQFLTESVMLSLLGARRGCGAWKAPAGRFDRLDSARPLAAQADVRLDLRVLAYLFLLAVFQECCSVFAPTIAAWRRDVSDGLKEGHRGSTGGVSGRRIRSALIVAEVALTFVLAATAGVLIHSFERLTSVETGFETTNVVSMNLPRAMGKDVEADRVKRC